MNGNRYDPTRPNELGAARAPTAVHEEPWAFVIVQDMAVLKSLSDRAKNIFASEAERSHPDQASLYSTCLPSRTSIFFMTPARLLSFAPSPKSTFVTADWR
jgi:hypothetical protein